MKRRVVAVLIVLFLAVVGLALVLVQRQPEVATAAAAPQSVATAGLEMYDTMAALSDDIGPRAAGKTREQTAAVYIAGRLDDAGYTTIVQDFTFGDGASSRNIVAVKAGVSTRRIVIGAHYDSVATGRGAFDNASGVALMLELAAQLQTRPTPYTLVFVAFGAEERGLKGSTHYVETMSAQEKTDTVLMVNLDSVATGDRLYAYSSAKQRWPQLTLRQMARAAGGTILTSPGMNRAYTYGTTGDWSDHAAFRRAGIPYLYVEATNWLLGEKDGDVNTAEDGKIWHTRKDTISYLEQRFPGRMAMQLGVAFTALYEFLQSQLPVAD